MRLFSLRPATAIRAATACALVFIVIVYTSLSALFSLLTFVLRSAIRAIAVLISAALLTSVLRSAIRAIAVLPVSAALLSAVLRSALRALTALTSAALLSAVLRSALQALTALTSAALLSAVLRSALRTVAILSSAALLSAVFRSALRAVTVAALHCAAVIAHFAVSVFFEGAAVLLTSAVLMVTLPTSAAPTVTVLRSALRPLSVRASFRHTSRSTVVSAIFTVDIRTVTHSHGPALASDGHSIILILLQIRGAKEQGVKRLRRSGILI